MSEPRDPLQNATFAVPVHEQVESNVPEAYRLTHRGTGGRGTHYILQGAFKSWNEQGMIFHEWRDIPTIEEREE